MVVLCGDPQPLRGCGQAGAEQAGEPGLQGLLQGLGGFLVDGLGHGCDRQQQHEAKRESNARHGGMSGLWGGKATAN